MWWLVLSAAAVLAAWLCYWLSGKYEYFERRGVRHAPVLPLVGSMWRTVFFNKHFIDDIKDAYRKFPHEKYFGIYEGLTPVLVIKDPDTIKKVTVKDADHFLDHRNSLVNAEDDSLITKAIVFLKGQKWRDMRSALSPAFTGSKMRMMLPFMTEITQQAVQYLNENAQKNGCVTEPIELYDLFTRCANDVIASCAFGVRVDSLHDRDNQFYAMGRSVSNFSKLKFFVVTLVPGVAKMLGINIFPKESTAFFRNLVAGAMEQRKTSGVVRNDMIHLLMEAKSGKLKHVSLADDAMGFATVQESQHTGRKTQWTDDELAAQAFIFFFAGFETTSTSLAFTVHELTISRHVQDKLRAEVDACHAAHAQVTYEVIQGLKYMDMVLSESLRRWAGAVVLDRECVKEYTFDPPSDGGKPYVMKPKDYLYIYVTAIHMDEKHFPNPEEFDPERFSDERKHDIKPFTYLPFGSGPRNCIGSRFALMELKVILYQLILNFELVACEKTTNPMRLAPGIKLAVANGSWIQFKPRSIQ